jgi:Mrp family chromosome partitioning ATPase
VVRVTPAPVPLERSLEGIIEKLSNLEQSPHVRALLIEARRLRSIIANWRSIPPLPQVREEMLARVLHISAAAGTAAPGIRTDSGMMRAVAQTQLMTDSSPLSGVGFPEDPPPMSERMAGEVTMVQAAIELPQTPLDVRQIGLPDDLDPRLVMLRDPFSRGADAYRALRHRLSSGGDPRIIAVTSAGPGEGKSTCAINLAAALREGARGRVLLCEANVRRPKLAQMLGFTPPECFGIQLARHRRAPLEAWIAVEQVAPLHVMAVDPSSTNVPLLDPVAFSIAMDRLRVAGYDYVVVDTPPVLGSADVNMISDSVDGVLFATLARKSTGKRLRQAIAQLGSTTVLGSVLLDA